MYGAEKAKMREKYVRQRPQAYRQALARLSR